MHMQPEFDAIAGQYDALFSGTAVGQAMRSRVWRLLDRLLPQHSADVSVLEVNCGTGLDAIWLANRGYDVLATDIAPEMVSITAQKVARAGARVRTQVCALEALDTLPREQFDLIFSNFGGLNCLDPQSLEQFAVQIQERLLPGGRFVAVVMGSCCAWEIIYFLLKGKLRQAFRRLGKQPLIVPLQNGTAVDTWYYTPKQFRKHFFGLFQEKLAPVGICLPPSYLAPFFEKRPRLLKWLDLWESRISAPVMARLADHFFVSLRFPGQGRFLQ